MSDTQTPNLELVYLVPSQSQPEVPINDAWNKIDALAVGLAGKITVKQVGDSPAGDAFDVTALHFVGLTVESQTDGVALITADSSSDGGGESLPAGGTTGQALVKTSGTDYAVGWATVSGGGGGGSVAVPGTIPDLVMWFESDNILGTNGRPIFALQDRTPWKGGVIATTPNMAPATGCITVGATQQNGLNVIKCPGDTEGQMTLAGSGWLLDHATVFVVTEVATGAAGGVIMSGPEGAFQVTLNGSTGFDITITYNSTIGEYAAGVPVGSFFQFNATFDEAAYAFRLSSAAVASGSHSISVTAATTSLFYLQPSAGSNCDNSYAAIIVYNRVLTLTEIESVEAYLRTKWGVS